MFSEYLPGALLGSPHLHELDIHVEGAGDTWRCINDTSLCYGFGGKPGTRKNISTELEQLEEEKGRSVKREHHGHVSSRKVSTRSAPQKWPAATQSSS